MKQRLHLAAVTITHAMRSLTQNFRTRLAMSPPVSSATSTSSPPPCSEAHPPTTSEQKTPVEEEPEEPEETEEPEGVTEDAEWADGDFVS